MELIRRSRWMRCARHVALTEEKLNKSRISVENPQGKRPLGRPRQTWDNNINLDLEEIG
jgi:hypothetical protein